MLKIAAIVSLMLIVATWSQADFRRYKKDTTSYRDYGPGSTMWAASLTCESCGKECESACGTRHFRSCCFNYLRRKRDPYVPMTWSSYPNMDALKSNSFMDNLPELYYNEAREFKPHYTDNSVDSRLQYYDA